MSKIEWTDITRNPIKGKCPTACPYCYARSIYDENKWDPDIRFRPDVLDKIPRKPCRIFVGSTMELFLFPEWLPEIFEKCRHYPEHTFIFLTKQPQELPQWSPFPRNCEVGVSVTNDDMLKPAFDGLCDIEAKATFISFEPLLERITPDVIWAAEYSKWLDWVIIGAMTGRKGKLLQLQEERYPHLRLEKLDAVGRKWTLQPRLEWVKDIVQAADGVGIPVFLKDNIYKLAMDRPAEDHDLYFEDMSTLRQELRNRSYGDQLVFNPTARVTSGGGH